MFSVPFKCLNLKNIYLDICDTASMASFCERSIGSKCKLPGLSVGTGVTVAYEDDTLALGEPRLCTQEAPALSLLLYAFPSTGWTRPTLA